MAVTLKEMLEATRQRVEQVRRAGRMAEMRVRATSHQPRGFRARLEQAGNNGVAIIAELKKASPSKGAIRGSFPVARLARELEAAGAAALSVLTEENYFEGSLANLQEASAATSLPCLRKDFIIDELQVVEARAHGADAVLLIVAALDEPMLRNLCDTAQELSLDVLCEIHDEPELERGLRAGCTLIGVNSRDLKTLKVDSTVPMRLAARLPAGVLRMAESGISSGDDVRRLRDAGYQAFLIGESLMRAESPGVALRELIAAATTSSAGKVTA